MTGEVRRAPRRGGLAALAALLLSGCSAEDLDCSLGAMSGRCPPNTVGFDRLQARLRTAERACAQGGLEPGSDAYAGCIEARMPALSKPALPMNRLGP